MERICPNCGKTIDTPDISKCPFCERDLSTMTTDYSRRHVQACARERDKESRPIRKKLAVVLGDLIGAFVGALLREMLKSKKRDLRRI